MMVVSVIRYLFTSAAVTVRISAGSIFVIVIGRRLVLYLIRYAQIVSEEMLNVILILIDFLPFEYGKC